MNKIFLILTTITLFCISSYAQMGNVGIGTSTPNASAKLDIDVSTGTKGGLLIPRLNLTGTGDITTIASPATGLLVFNLTAAGSGSTAVAANSFYYYDGSKWIRMLNNATAWLTLGNEGTTPSTASAGSPITAGSNFIGTTDNKPLIFATNNGTNTYERMRIDNTTGHIAINSTSINPDSWLYTYRASTEYGANKTGIYSYRAGTSGATNGGTNWGVTAVDASIKGHSHWGNNYSAGVYGSTEGDYSQSAGVVGAYTSGATSSVWGALAYSDAAGDKWANYDSGNVHISGFLQVGNTSVPYFINTTYSIYNIDFGTSNWWNYVLVTTNSPCNTSVGWSYGNNGMTYTFFGSSSNQYVTSPFIWIPNTYTSNLVARLTHRDSITDVAGYDGVTLEYSTDAGATFSTVSSWASNGYGATSKSSSSTICTASAFVKWDATTTNRTSVSNAITSGITTNKWVQFRLRASEDASGGANEIIRASNFSLIITGTSSHPTIFTKGSIYAEGHVYAQSNSQIGDVAEYFPIEGKSEPGMLISMSEKGTSLNRISNGKMDAYIFGVHSKNPSVLLNSPSQGTPVALSGRTEVKVVNENGQINAGDYLTASSTSGYAMKATEPCYIIGRAMQNINGDLVMTIIQPGWYNPSPSSEKIQSSSAKYTKNLKSLKIFDNAIKVGSKVFVSFRGNPGSASWIDEIGDGFFTLLLDKEATTNIPFDYLVNNPVITFSNKSEEDKVTNNKNVPEVAYLSDEMAWSILNQDGSSQRVNVGFKAPPPPSDPSKMWTWDPLNGYKEIKSDFKEASETIIDYPNKIIKKE